MSTIYEKLSQPRYAAQAVRDWAAEYNDQSEVVLRIDTLDLAQAYNRDNYAFMRLSFDQIDNDGMFRTHTSSVFDGLEIQAVASGAEPERGFYSWQVVYNGDRYALRAIGLGKATVVLDTLKYVERAMERARDKGLQPTTFAQYVTFVANTLGVRSARVRGKHDIYRGADMSDVLGILSSAEDEWTRGILPEREQAA